MIPDRVIKAYVTQYPHLAKLGSKASTSRQAELAFASNACRLSAAPGASARDIWALAGVAVGLPWPEIADSETQLPAGP